VRPPRGGKLTPVGKVPGGSPVSSSATQVAESDPDGTQAAIDSGSVAHGGREGHAVIAGFGLGLRPAHYADLEAGVARVEWLEALSENYLVPGGKPLQVLDRLRESYPMVLHGVAMSIAGTEPLDRRYLEDLRRLAMRIEPAWISDHLCWTGVGGTFMHDLLPIPFSVESLSHVAQRVHAVQEILRRPLVLENVSTYVRASGDAMSEWEFLAALVHRTGCGLVLDVNNVYVNAVNHGFEPAHFIHGLPPSAVRQVHLGGHTVQGSMLIDSHDTDVCAEVWKLYEEAVAVLGPVPTMIERDDEIPPLAELVDELDLARAASRRVLDRVTPHDLAA
jgi:uncharacterized protein (UPF0276 family)